MSEQMGPPSSPVDRLCEQCSHVFDPHVLIATGSDPIDGGIILCPEPGCACWSTWSLAVGGGHAPPPDHAPARDSWETSLLRARVQAT